MTEVIGWDIGGAHLKAVRLQSNRRVLAVTQQPCPLWRGLEHLQQAVDRTMTELNPVGQSVIHALTMTGELADIFPDRRQGVMRIIEVMAAKLPKAELRLFAGEQGMVEPAQVNQYLAEIASANWLATAQFVAQKVGQGVLMDMGSTTTDIILLQQGKAQPRALTDGGRLTTEELVYTGVIRTPVMAVVRRVPFNGEWQRLAAEHFATMADVYRLNGKLDPGHDMSDSADGAEKTAEHSARRLARMVGRDVEDASMACWINLAQFIADAQLQDVKLAVERVLARSADPLPIIGAGAGYFVPVQLAQQMQNEYIAFHDLVDVEDALKNWIDVCAPAYSVAWLGMS